MAAEPGAAPQPVSAPSANEPAARSLPAGRLGAISVCHRSPSESSLSGAFVRARRALNRPKRRFPAWAVDEIDDEADPKAALVSLLLGRAAASVGDPGQARDL